MKTLNLETKGKEQELIKQYLEENVSEILADKINNGVKITKENKELTNFKTLDGFMVYASSEARKLAQKNNYACVEDKVVFGWAIHYFEEDSIEEKLFNPDGSEYKTQVKQTVVPTPQVKVEAKPVNTQSSLFDFISKEEPKQETEIETEIENEIEEEPDVLFDDDNYKIDKNTGEVLSPVEPITQTKDNEVFNILNELFDNKLIYKE